MTEIAPGRLNEVAPEFAELLRAAGQDGTSEVHGA